MELNKLIQKAECQWEIPMHGNMRVPARIFASQELLQVLEPKALDQAANVACLPGIVKASMAMPDAHWGYGFPIGGVAAFDPDKGGVISVGGIGYDISCGVRTLRIGLQKEEILPYLKPLMDALFKGIPAGVGSEGLISLNESKLDEVMLEGAKWAIKNGYGSSEDLEYIEDNGQTTGADPSKVSQTAKKRQKKQIGTLGSGNHYLEIQCVEEVFDHFTAEAFKIAEGDILISIHCGSRALGHQIGTDYIQTLGLAVQKYNISLPERELVCAPINSPEGQNYYKAMVCGTNCAMANRQVICHLVREIFQKIMPQASLSLLYDISHNTCKIEEHYIDNQSKRKLYVHRKGATRAFGPNRAELPQRFKNVGQPVLIGGTMGTHSYILAGNESGQELAWNSACHGAGRAMSRRQALKKWKGKSIINDLSRQGIIVRVASKKGAAEEAPQAYKNVDQVVDNTHKANLARKVAKLRPLACLKG